MPIKVVCPSCGRTLNARDEHAGRTLKCPACAAAVTVPAAPQEVDDLVEAEAAPPPRRPAPRRDDDYDNRDDDRGYDDRDYDRPRRQVGPNIFANKGLSGPGTILMFCGIAVLVLLLVSVFFPWRSGNVSVNFPGAPREIGFPGGGMGISAPGISGIQVVGGIITLILSLLTIAFVLVALFVLTPMLFKVSLWTAFGVSLGCAILALLAAVIKSTPPELAMFGGKGGIDVSIGGAWGAWVAMFLGLIASGLFIATVLSVRTVSAPRPRRAPVDDED
jgi:Zn-finger nucleic acid-binding protein